MLSLSRTARTLRGAQCARRFSAEIPIKTVCRVVSCDVKDEAAVGAGKPTSVALEPREERGAAPTISPHAW